MATFRAQVFTTQPVDEAFDFMATFSNTAEWDPGVASATRSGSGRPSLGETFDLEIRMGSRTMPMTYEIIDLDRPTTVVLRSETDRLVSLDTIRVRGTETGTVIDYTAELTLKGLLGRVADPFLGIVFNRIAEKAVEGLREHVA